MADTLRCQARPRPNKRSLCHGNRSSLGRRAMRGEKNVEERSAAERKQKKNQTVVFTCGGTGGHIYPAIAIADRIRQVAPGVKIDFLGSRERMEWSLVPKHGYRIRDIPCAPLHRPLKSWRNLKSIFLQLLGLLKALLILVCKRPAAVIGTGGYICVPTCTAAWILRVPVFLHESNAFPGLATRFLVNTLRAAEQVFLGFADAKMHLKTDRTLVTVTGNPVRDGISPENRSISKDAAVIRLLGGKGGEKEEKGKGKGKGKEERSVCICFMGGSLGAGKINEVLQGCKTSVLRKFPNVKIIWQTGEKYYQRAIASSPVGTSPGVEREELRGRLLIVPFLHDMETVYAACDLFVCRAGAITCSELLASRRPSILVPSPNVTDDHQKKNAEVLHGLGGAVVMDEENFKADSLVRVIDELMREDRKGLSEMETALCNASNVNHAEEDACGKISKSIAECVQLPLE